MEFLERFSDAELETIVSEGTIYMCACPAYVADAARKLRALYYYQQNCLQTPSNDVAVHQAIAHSAAIAHAELEDCMEKILALEGWDRSTLQMPANLRVRQMQAIQGD
jgi:hypothetical protein